MTQMISNYLVLVLAISLACWGVVAARTWSHRIAAAGVVLLACFGVSLTAQAYQLFGVGQVIWAAEKSLAASGCLTSTKAGSTCMLFPAGSGGDHKAVVNVISAEAAGVCCWSLDNGFTVTNEMIVNSTQGGCFKIRAAGQTWHQRVDWAQFLAMSGSTISGLCSVAITSGFQSTFAPCDANADCNSPYGGGTCTANASLTDAQKRSAGLYLICAPGSGTVIFEASKDKVDL